MRADPLVLDVSAICFFRSGGPGDCDVDFPFWGVPFGGALSVASWMAPVGSAAALLSLPGSFGEHTAFRLAQWYPSTSLFGAPWDLRRPPLRAHSLTEPHSASAPSSRLGGSGGLLA